MLEFINISQPITSGETVFAVPSGFIPRITVYVDIFIGDRSVAHAYAYSDIGQVIMHNSNISTDNIYKYITFNCTYIVA